MNTVRAHFLRTICACPQCSRFCKRMPGCLAPGDAEAIAEHLGTNIEAVAENLAASPGALVERNGVRFRIGTIVPARKSDGSCVWLDDDGRCTIHPVAPFGCAYFDEHQTPREGNRRSSVMLQAIMQDESYRALRTKLEAAGRVAPAPEALRKQLA